MQELEQRRERLPRTTSGTAVESNAGDRQGRFEVRTTQEHDYMDVGVRVTLGAATELSEQLPGRDRVNTSLSKIEAGTKEDAAGVVAIQIEAEFVF
jgi:hypothetical protein